MVILLQKKTRDVLGRKKKKPREEKGEGGCGRDGTSLLWGS
jgi:hypothetical protein